MPVQLQEPVVRGAAASARPRLCFVGPMMPRALGYTPTPGLLLAEHLAAANYPVTTTSSQTNRYARLFDMIGTLVSKRHQIDIQFLEVYGRQSFVVEDMCSRIGKLLGQRVVMFLHGGALPEFLSKYPMWTRRVLSRADALVAPSRYLARVVGRHGFRVHVVPYVLDLSRYPYRHRTSLKPRLFWMRMFHPVYNPAMAIRVFARLKRDVGDATLVMAGGDKGSLAEVQELARRMGVSDSVRFPGFLSLADIAREGDTADIFINTNHLIDNTPVAVVEACAMGLPVVATAVGGVPDLLTNGENGLLVGAEDENEMVLAIKRLLSDPALAGRLSANGPLLAEQFGWERVRSGWEQIFDQVVTIGHV